MPKTVLITGASRGIGRAAALAFAECGHNLVINCINNSKQLDDVKQEILQRGAACTAFVGDVSDFDTAKSLFDAAHDACGAIDILVNNAGISMCGLFQDMTRAEWEHLMNTNIGSVYNCCHFAVKDMLAAKSGRIINISSVWGIVGASCEVAYSASKGAVNAFTKALAKELAPSNIQVNAIACGAIDTDMNARYSPDELSDLCEAIPAGRMGLAAEVAKTVLALADSCAYLTGQVITLDGGWT